MVGVQNFRRVELFENSHDKVLRRAQRIKFAQRIRASYIFVAVTGRVDGFNVKPDLVSA